MGDRTQKPINIENHREEIAKEEGFIKSAEETIKSLQPIQLEINRISWAVNEMYFQDDFIKESREPNRALDQHQAKAAFNTRPHDKSQKIEMWKSDNRTIGEILASATETLEKAIPLIHEGLSHSGIIPAADRDQDIIERLSPISTMAKNLLKRQRPDIAKTT